MNIQPGFLNYKPHDPSSPCGYECIKDYDEYWPFSWGPWSKTIWYFELNELTPLMYVREDGVFVKPSIPFYDTDFGSIPIPLRSLPSLNESRFLLGYLFHDNIYRTHWVFASKDQGISWSRKDMTRSETDDQLKEMILHDPQPGTLVARNTIWSMVRLFGNSPWTSQTDIQPQSKAIKDKIVARKMRGI